MKKDVNNKKYYCETFQEVHAPKALAGKVINMTKKNKNSTTFYQKVKLQPKYFITFVLRYAV